MENHQLNYTYNNFLVLFLKFLCYNGYIIKLSPKKGAVILMEAIQAYYDGNVFVPITPVKVKKNQPAIITIIESAKVKEGKKRHVELFGALSPESYLEIMEF